MAFQLTINAVDYSNYYVADSLEITESLHIRGFTMAVDIEIENGAISPPLGGQFIKFTSAGVREFAGRIGSVTEIHSGNPTIYIYHLDCIDQTVDFDAHLINEVLPTDLAGEMFRTIIAEVGRGFTANAVADGVAIQEQRADYIQPSAIASRIAEMIEHQWYIDYLRDIHFFFINANPAPIPTINIDTDTVTYGNAKFQEMWEQVKNRIYLTGAKVKSGTQDGVLVQGDGDTKFVPLNYEPWSTGSMTVKLDGITQTLLIDGVDGRAGDGAGSAGQALVCLDNWGVRFPDNFPPGAGVDIDVDYNYAYEPVIVVEDPVSIEIMRAREDTPEAPSDGVHELRFDIPDLRVDSENAIWEYGQLLLARYAQIVTEVTFDSYVQGWAVGQIIRVTSAVRMSDFDRDCYVTRVQKKINTVSPVAELQYNITLSTSIFPGQ